MTTHRIILPAAQHEAALRGVDRLLLPMRVQPETDEVPGVAWFHVGDRTYGGKRAFAEDGCIYKPGDRMALLEPFQPMRCMPWKPASRMPLRACRCFYRVLAVEPVRECDAWVWAVRPVEPANSGLNWAWAVRVERWTK